MPFSRIPCAAVGAWYRGKLFGVYFAVARCGSELSGVGQWLMIFGALQWTGLDWIIWKQEALRNSPKQTIRTMPPQRALFTPPYRISNNSMAPPETSIHLRHKSSEPYRSLPQETPDVWTSILASPIPDFTAISPSKQVPGIGRL